MIAKNSLEAETHALIFLLKHITNITIDSNKIIIHTDSINLWTNVNNFLAGNSPSIQYAKNMDLVHIRLIHLAHDSRTYNT